MFTQKYEDMCVFLLNAKGTFSFVKIRVGVFTLYYSNSVLEIWSLPLK